ncbi:MAG: hypothetical protein WCQ26_13485 [Pseudanabaena sp. ELA748]
MNTEAQNIVKREARWTFCLALYNWRDQGAIEPTFRAIANAMRFGLSDAEIREQLFYLKEKGLCTIEKNSVDGGLFALRTSALIDVVEFSAPCPDGIARPATKWWET